MHIEKTMLPKGLSYPLKSLLMKDAIDKAQIITDISLVYSSNHTFFEAFCWLPNSNIDYDRFYIKTGAVESADSKNAREYMEQCVIPEFIVWSREILSMPLNSSRFNLELHFSMRFYKNPNVIIELQV